MHHLCLPVNIPDYGSSPKHCFSIFLLSTAFSLGTLAEAASREVSWKSKEGELAFVKKKKKYEGSLSTAINIKGIVLLRHL